MHKPESVLENKTKEIFWDFKIQNDPLIPARRPDRVMINKKDNLPNSGLCCPGKPQRDHMRKRKEK